MNQLNSLPQRRESGKKKKKDTSIKLFTPHQLFQGVFFFFTSRLENELSNRKKKPEGHAAIQWDPNMLKKRADSKK